MPKIKQINIKAIFERQVKRRINDADVKEKPQPAYIHKKAELPSNLAKS